MSSFAQSSLPNTSLMQQGVITDVFVHARRSRAQLESLPDQPGFALLTVSCGDDDALRGLIELDAPACRHLADLLNVKASELEARS